MNPKGSPRILVTKYQVHGPDEVEIPDSAEEALHHSAGNTQSVPSLTTLRSLLWKLDDNIHLY
jgi:hypothetical protein